VVDETEEEVQRLMLTLDVDARNSTRQRRNTSAALLKKELVNDAANTDAFLTKVYNHFGSIWLRDCHTYIVILI